MKKFLVSSIGGFFLFVICERAFEYFVNCVMHVRKGRNYNFQFESFFFKQIRLEAETYIIFRFEITILILINWFLKLIPLKLSEFKAIEI